MCLSKPARCFPQAVSYPLSWPEETEPVTRLSLVIDYAARDLVELVISLGEHPFGRVE